MINYDTKGLTDCPNPFDPGAVIDDNGVGWLAFGGGKAGAWTSFRSVDFSLDGDNVRKGFTANIKGSGTVEVRLDSPTGELVASVTKDNGIAAEIPDITGTHDLFFVFSREGMAVENWGFTAEGKTFVIDNKVIGISAIAAAAVIGAIVFAASKAKAKKK